MRLSSSTTLSNFTFTVPVPDDTTVDVTSCDSSDGEEDSLDEDENDRSDANLSTSSSHADAILPGSSTSEDGSSL